MAQDLNTKKKPGKIRRILIRAWNNLILVGASIGLSALITVMAFFEKHHTLIFISYALNQIVGLSGWLSLVVAAAIPFLLMTIAFLICFFGPEPKK